MESRDFFGAPDPQDKLSAPSVLSLVARTCADDFAGLYFVTAEGNWYERDTQDGSRTAFRVSEDKVRSDVLAWVAGLEGGGNIGRRITDMIGSSPGWAVIIASRVIRELRKCTEV